MFLHVTCTSITSLVLAQVRTRARAKARARVVSSCNLY